MSNNKNMKSAYKQWIKELDAFQKAAIGEDQFTDQAFEAGWMAALKDIRFDPDRQIAIIWDIDDVKEIRPDLNDADCMRVLRRVENKCDAEFGVTWETLEAAADYLFPEGGGE